MSELTDAKPRLGGNLPHRTKKSMRKKRQLKVIPRRILIVDDNADAANSLAMNGYELARQRCD